MRETTVAERYAIALLEIGTEAGSLDTMLQELRRVDKLFKDSNELRVVFDHPKFSVEVRKSVLSELLEKALISPTSRNFMFLLTDRGRTRILSSIVSEFERLIDQKVGRVRAEVTVARSLTPPEQSRLLSSLKRMTGRDVKLEQRVDPSIISGAITRIDGKLYDGSLRAQLHALGEQLRSNI